MSLYSPLKLARQFLPLALLAIIFSAPFAVANAEAPNAAGILYHRALYDLSYVPGSNSTQVGGATGRMAFSWGDACAGWTVEQKMQIKFFYNSGEETALTSSLATFEAKDGSLFRFNVRRQQNGIQTEAYTGTATRLPDGSAVATYNLPADLSVKLDEGTLFPSAHTLEMLRTANAGGTLMNRSVFDGSDEEGQSEINVFITKAPEGDLAADSVKAEWVNSPHWLFRLAFFKLGKEAQEPDYEMNIDLHANGVARTLLIDYGDFKISGRLVELEELPGCPEDAAAAPLPAAAAPPLPATGENQPPTSNAGNQSPNLAPIKDQQN